MIPQWVVDWAHKFLIGMMERPGTVGATRDLGTGVDIEAERADRRAKLRAACEAGVNNPEWRQKVNGTTFCNFHNMAVAHVVGCSELDGLMANQQIEAAMASPNFSMEPAERAHAHVMKGGFAFAGEYGKAHGHVTPLIDEPMQESGSWGKPAVMVAHVGKHPNGIMRCSQAFRQEPRYFLWRVEDI